MKKITVKEYKKPDRICLHCGNDKGLFVVMVGGYEFALCSKHLWELCVKIQEVGLKG